MVSKRKSISKIIKKTGRALAWVFGIFLLLIVGSYFALKSPACQTWMAQRTAEYLSKELRTKVSIRSVDIEFFKKVNLDGIFIQDRHGDTLLFAEHLQADIHRFDYENHYLSISSILLSDSKIKLKKYPGEHGLSYRFIQDYFKSTDTTKKTNAPWQVDLGGVSMRNNTFIYIDTRDTIDDPGMDYENIRVTNVNGRLTDIDLANDSVSLRIVGLQGKERCGLTLQNFSTRLTVGDSVAIFDNLQFVTQGGTLSGFVTLNFKNKEDVADDFIHLVKINGHFSNSVIEMGEIAYFSPQLFGIRKKVLFTGDIRGTIEHLRLKNVDLSFGEISHVSGNFAFNGLPNMDETDMNFMIREAVTNKKDLEGIPSYPFDKGGHLEVADNIGQLGNMVFTGSFEGFLNDFVAHGNLHTNLGNLRLNNIAMTRESDSSEYSYVGEVVANHFNIGSFYTIPDLTFVSGDVSVAGSGLSNASINAKIDGRISELNYHGYPYRGITVSNGKFRRQVFDGDFKIDDPNLKMVFNGKVDNSNAAVPDMEFDASIQSANLGELGFLDKENEYLLSTDLHMKFKGSNIDNLDGQIVVRNMHYKKNGEKFNFNEFNLFAGNNADGTRTIFLESDVVRATLKGRFQLMHLPDAIADLLSNYLPAYFLPDAAEEEKHDIVQEFTWFVNFQNNTKPIQALVPKLEIAPGTSFSGKFEGKKKLFNTSFNSASITYKDIVYKGIQLNADNSSVPGACTLNGTLEELKITDTVGTKNMVFSCKAYHDSVFTSLRWDNKTVKLNDASIFGLAHFENQKSIKFNFYSTQLHLNDSLWTISPGNFVRIDSNRITVSDLVFHSGTASIGLNGFVSPRETDELKISMKNFNIAYLNYFTVPQGVTLAGIISSETGLSNLYETPIFTCNADFKSFIVNGQKLGDGELDAVWQKNKQAVYLHGHFTRGIPDPNSSQLIDNILFDGYYYPKNKENSIDINASFVNIPLDVFTPILKDYCSLINGQFGGSMHITGTPGKPLLNGKMDVFPRRIKVDYLGLALSGPQQTIYIEENSIFFDDFKVTDGYNDTAKIYGHLFHDNFKKFQFDMDISFNHFLVLNTTQAQNELYYGRVFASGYLNIFGFVDDIIRIDMSAKTEKIMRNGQPLYSEFNIPMTTTSEVGSSDFISFVDKSAKANNGKGKQLKNNGMELHLNVQATNDAIVKVIFDKTVGDELTAYGNGSLQMDITPSGDFTIFGRYEVDKGNYLFTMKNVILVPFDLAKGGVISWNGDPYDAQINADAVYKTTASVEPFFPTDSTNPAYHRSYPVEVLMRMNNNLMNPDVSFEINLPTADQNIQETVKSYTQAELEKNRQVLSLMVLNSFMTPTELRDGNTEATNVAGGTYSTLLSNFVSGTMNNWLSQISSDFNMGVKYRPNDDLTTQELKVYLGTQLMNNRITIDGNVGKVNANQTTSTTGTNGQWVGDMNVEYKVTDDGKVRLRAFNRSNDNSISTSNSAYTQGAGIFYREEFETGKQLKKRYKGYFTPKKKKAAGNTPSKDSTK